MNERNFEDGTMPALGNNSILWHLQDDLNLGGAERSRPFPTGMPSIFLRASPKCQMSRQAPMCMRSFHIFFLSPLYLNY